MSSNVGLGLLWTGTMGFCAASWHYYDMLIRARRNIDNRTQSLHHMLYHDKELTFFGMKPPASLFSGSVLWSKPRKWCVSEYSSEGGYTIIATGQACEHCGLIDQDHVTNLHITSMQDEDHYHGLAHPDVRHQTFSYAYAWMTKDDLVEPLREKRYDEIREECKRQEDAFLAQKALLASAPKGIVRSLMDKVWP